MASSFLLLLLPLTRYSSDGLGCHPKACSSADAPVNRNACLAADLSRRELLNPGARAYSGCSVTARRSRRMVCPSAPTTTLLPSSRGHGRSSQAVDAAQDTSEQGAPHHLRQLEHEAAAVTPDPGADLHEPLAQGRAENDEFREKPCWCKGDELGRKAAETIAARLSRHWWVRTMILPEATPQPDIVPENEFLALLGRPR
jgi:hypothetical protein